MKLSTMKEIISVIEELYTETHEALVLGSLRRPNHRQNAKVTNHLEYIAKLIRTDIIDQEEEMLLNLMANREECECCKGETCD